MLKRSSLRKIIITSFSLLTLFLIYIIPDSLKEKEEYLDIDMDIEYVDNLDTNEIYLLGSNNYLIKTNVLVNKNDIYNTISDIIEYLTIDKSTKIPDGLKGIIPKNTEVNNLEINDNIVTIDFNKDILNISDTLEERMVEAITYSIINIDKVEGVIIKVEGEILKELPNSKKKIPEILTRNYGINKVYEIDNLNGIQKVTLYYLDKISNNSYYVPVTKYVNDSRDKINIIIDNLSSNFIYENSLISMLNQNTELLDYSINDQIMTLNFNENIYNNEKLLETVTYEISESVFDNYDVDNIIFQINGKNITTIEK